MSATRALWVLAGPRARQHLRERGLRPADVRAVAGAAGGPKGLVLNPLDRFVFGHWLNGHAQPVHLLGASIGAWRLACACRLDADAALREMAEDYIEQRYEHEPGRPRCWRIRGAGCMCSPAAARDCSRARGACARRSVIWARSPPT
jgi:hypothetical protein